jgi:formate/nitrite transporter
MDKSFFCPEEIAQNYIEIGRKKAEMPALKQFILGILAGAFIAFASQGANAAIHTISSVGLAKALAGALFSAGLMMVIVAGAELFTGNCLIVISYNEHRSSLADLLKNWFFVYTGNFVGAMIVVFLILKSGQLGFSNGLLGGFTIKMAVYKTELTFGNAFFMGILCNWLVCTAVWMAAGARDMAGKILAIFFPIWLFITSGFEHSVANMYYIPAGILAKPTRNLYRLPFPRSRPEKIAALDWGSFVISNLIPVTLGNIVGGAIFVGAVYWFVYLYKKKASTEKITACQRKHVKNKRSMSKIKLLKYFTRCCKIILL